MPLAGLLDEVAQHHLGHVEVGDDAVLERALGDYGAGGASNHALCVRANGEYAALALVDGDDGGLIDDNTLATHGNERVGGAQVDGEVATILAKK